MVTDDQVTPHGVCLADVRNIFGCESVLVLTSFTNARCVLEGCYNHMLQDAHKV